MAVRILIVEDDPNLIVPLQYLLERRDDEVMAIFEGGQALEPVSAFHILALSNSIDRVNGPTNETDAYTQKPDSKQERLATLNQRRHA